MPHPLRLLMAEDDPVDAELVIRELTRAGYVPKWERVDNEAAFVAALGGEFDLVLSDYQMPGFTGLRALELLRKAGRDVPFILVSGMVGEDTAVEAVQQGAADYLIKDRLARLGSAVERALAEAAERRERAQALAALHESQEQLRLLAEHMPDVFWSTSPDHRIVHYVSPAYEAVWGRSVESLQANPQSWLEAVVPEDRERVKAALDELSFGMPCDMEFRILRPDGSERWVLDHGSAVRDAGGRITRLVGAARDITAQKRAEAVVEKASRTAASGRPAAFALEFGIVVLASAVAYLLALRFDWFEGLMVWTSLRGVERMDEVVLALVVLAAGMAAVALRHWRKARQDLIAHAHGQDALRALHDELDLRVKERTAALATSSEALLAEVVERQRAEHSLRASEERFRQVVENIHEVFWMLDLEAGRMLYVSPGFERVWGRTAEMALTDPQTWLESVHPEDRERVIAARGKPGAPVAAVAEGELSFRIVRPDGAVRWIRDRAFPVQDAGGRVHRVVGVSEDVTESKQLEAQFLRAQRLEAVGTLSGGIAHDLNNILSPILMVAPMVKEKLPTEEDRLMADIVEQSARRGAGIIRQLLTFSRGVEGDRGPVSVHHLVREMAAMMRETFPRQIAIVMHVPRQLALTIADATQVHQVLMNLCVNARDAMPDGGTLTIAAENTEVTAAEAAMHPPAKPGRHVEMTVTDTGAGIPPENLVRIFEPFFTTKAHGRGTGLGLSSVLGIVRSHGGFVTVQSKVGRGSTFRVALPAAPDDAVDGTGEAEAPPPHGRGEHLLVIDDEAQVLESQRLVLEDAGYRVTGALRGEAALGMFRAQAMDIALVLTDVMMPGMSGVEVVRALRAIRPDIAIVATTGEAPGNRREQLAQLGVATILAKPCSSRELLRAVDAALRRKG